MEAALSRQQWGRERARPQSALLFSALFHTLYCILLLLHFTAEEREAFFFSRTSQSIAMFAMHDGRTPPMRDRFLALPLLRPLSGS